MKNDYIQGILFDAHRTIRFGDATRRSRLKRQARLWGDRLRAHRSPKTLAPSPSMGLSVPIVAADLLARLKNSPGDVDL
ncbi:MAG TPA: hypothetical protein VHT70_05565 [Candidatus Saccharimonadales bacterium]|jgi:hypothetical protein|nr:hypothetical protein [Candidatus Saccharimonadales bacterium]